MDQKSTLEKTIIPPEMALGVAIARLTSAKLKILLVCDENKRLLGILTDGDIRRAILDGKELNLPCGKIANSAPVVAREGISEERARYLIEQSLTVKINCLPIVDHDNRVIDIFRREDLKPSSRPITALIMAGGFGKRLGYLTKRLPKPLLKVGGQPLLDHILQQLKEHEIHKAFISTHFLAVRIKNHIGDGSKFGIEVRYIDEIRPLGTAGAIGLLPPMDDTLLMMNGDILTEINLKAMVEFHRVTQSDMTVAVRKYSVEFPYGVVECAGNKITGLVEKPISHMFVNAGIYLLEPAIRRFVEPGTARNMDEMICELIRAGRDLAAFPVIEYWLDIGKKSDYQVAKKYDRRLEAA